MKPYFETDLGRLYHGDCLETLPELGPVDLVLTDPPYGIGFVHRGNDTGGIGKGRYATRFSRVAIIGDSKPFDPAPLLAYPAVVLWGANHFANKLPCVPSWLVWDKRAASGHTNDFADCELAWSSCGGVARVFRHHWDGMMRASEKTTSRVHPTQKPIALMEWCLSFFPKARTVCDPYLGSGTTAVACERLNRKWIGIEIEEKYCEIAARRIERETAQLKLFPKEHITSSSSGPACNGDLFSGKP